MPPLFRATPLFALVLLAGCSSGTVQGPVGPTLNRPNPDLGQMQPQPQPALTPASLPMAASPAAVPGGGVTSDISTYVDGSVIARLSPRDRGEASSAQYNALTFGRPGAPRAWVGDAGVSGQVMVGPYVRVNNIDCRDFTHTVTVGGTPLAKKGTACREADGSWNIVG